MTARVKQTSDITTKKLQSEYRVADPDESWRGVGRPETRTRVVARRHWHANMGTRPATAKPLGLLMPEIAPSLNALQTKGLITLGNSGAVNRSRIDRDRIYDSDSLARRSVLCRSAGVVHVHAICTLRRRSALLTVWRD